MNEDHKNALRTNRTTLVKDMDLRYVFDGLVERNIFEPDDYEDFEAQGKSRRPINQRFLTSLERRGPDAFAAFVASLREHKHGILADLLDPVSSPAYPVTPDNRPGRVTDNPADALSGGDSGSAQPMDCSNEAPKTIVTSPTEDIERQKWPDNKPALLTDVVMTQAPVGDDDMDQENVYQMKSKPRGVAVVINNKHFRTMNTRKGTDIDGKNLQHIFEKLGFNVLVREDQTGEQMQQIMRDLSTHNHESFDCFVLAILSHGIEGAIYGVDERIIKIEHITAYFEGGRCPSLAGKPKLFFLQACRGERFDGGHEAVDSAAPATASAAALDNRVELTDEELAKRMLERELEDQTDAFNKAGPKLPSQSDMLLAYATVPGFVSWRNSERGSWFIQALSEVFLANAHKEDVLSMMTMVNNKVARAFESSSGRNKQIPAPVTMLRKKLFFNPGR
jgi:hypothetical protein